MKDKIMTPEEYELSIASRFSLGRADLAEAYAHYYAKHLIESLTDEEIDNKGHDTPRIEIALGRIDGAKWARQELLNRLNQRP